MTIRTVTATLVLCLLAVACSSGQPEADPTACESALAADPETARGELLAEEADDGAPICTVEFAWDDPAVAGFDPLDEEARTISCEAGSVVAMRFEVQKGHLAYVGRDTGASTGRCLLG